MWESDGRHVSEGFVGRIMTRVVETYAGEALTTSADAALRFHDLALQKRWAEAREAYGQVEEPPADARECALFNLDGAELFLNFDEPEQARRCVTGIEARTLNADERLRLADICDRLGLTEKGDHFRNSSLTIRPGATGRTVRARVGRLLEAGRTRDALLVLGSLLEQEANGDVLSAVGDMYLRLGKPDEARAAYAKAGSSA
jgi:hypothetical protein